MSAVNSMPYVKAIGWGLLLGGVAIFILTATMNYLQGDIWAVTEHGKIVNRWSAVIIDAVGIVIVGFAAGAAAAAGKRAWAWGLTVMMLLSAVASINSMASFQATERMSASKSREAEIGRAKVADDLSKESVAKTLTLAGKAKSTAAREDYMYGNQEAIKAFRESKVQVQIAPDAGAELWASLSGWSLDRIQMFQAAYLAILLIILKMVCFQASGFFLNPLAWVKSNSLSSSPKGGAGSGGENVKTSDGSKPKQDENVIPIRAEPAQFQPVGNSPTPQGGRPPPQGVGLRENVRSVEFGAPRPSLKSSPRDLDDYLADLKAGTVLPNNRQLAKMFGTSEPTMSRKMRRKEGRKEVKRERKGRAVQTIVLPRRNGVLHAVI